MSGIAGIYYFDGRPVDRQVLQRMTDALARRGGDRRGEWMQDAVGLSQVAWHTTPESQRERQPLVHGPLSLIFDGRVDNREELGAALEREGARWQTGTDAELVLRAYERWNEDCPGKLLGDFSLAVWDDLRHCLFCARDALGVRPFYYCRHPRFFAFASDPAALFAVPEFAKRPNLEAMADYLLNHLADSEPTEFEGVYRLRPAHSLTVSASGVRIRQYWDIDPERVLRLSRPQEYEEAFLEVFAAAVRDRLRSCGRVGMLLSGGLDSSSILALIEDLKCQGKLTADLRAYCVLFDGQPYDEGHYMRSFQQRWGTEVRWCRPQPPRPLWGLAEAGRADHRPLQAPMAYIVDDPLRTAASEETRVLLAGVGGDDFMDAPAGLAAELFLAGHPLKAWKYVAALAQFHSVSFARAVQYAFVFPLRGRLAPDWFKRLYRKARPATSRPEWLREPHRSAALKRSTRQPWYLAGREFSSSARRSTYGIVHMGHRILALEMWDRLAAAAGPTEVRQPFCDRRLVELASSIPDPEMVRGGEPKGLLRATLGARLPDLIRQRRDKADFAALINQRLIFEDAPAARALLAKTSLGELGLVDEAMTRSAYHTYCEKYKNRLTAKEAVATIWPLFSLEAWARATFGSSVERSSRRNPDG